MSPNPPIEEEEVWDYDVTVDIAIRPKKSWDDSREWIRLRTPLFRVMFPEGLANLEAAVADGMRRLLSERVRWPSAAAEDPDVSDD